MTRNKTGLSVSTSNKPHTPNRYCSKEPQGGRIGGVLTFDDTDDRLYAKRRIYPIEGSFCVLARVQGGVSGKISQFNSANWLGEDRAWDYLMA